MILKNINQKRSGIILAYFTEGVKILSVLLYTPIMLRSLGQSAYGLYQLVSSIVSYLGLMSLGFSSSYLRFYSLEEKTGNKDNVSRLNGLFLLVFCTISVIALLSGVVLISNIKTVLGADLSDNEIKEAKILMFFMIINLSLSFPNSIFDSFITSQERFLFQKLISLLSALFNPFLMIIVLTLGYGSIGMVIVTTSITLVTLIVNVFYCTSKLEMRFLFSNLKFGLLKRVLIFSSFIFLNQIVTQINWTLDKVLLGRMIGTTAVAIYGVSSQINSLLNQSSRNVVHFFFPKVNKIVAYTNDNNQLSSVFIKVGRIQFFILSLILLGIIFMGKPFIFLWAGDEYSESYDLCLVLNITHFVPLIQNLGGEIQKAKNKHWFAIIVNFVVALVNIGISIPLISKFGTIGAAMGTAFSVVAGDWFFMNWYYSRRIGLDVKRFWINIVSMSKGLLVPIFFGFFILRRINLYNIYSFSLTIVVFSCVYFVSMFFLGLNDSERSAVKSILKKIIK